MVSEEIVRKTFAPLVKNEGSFLDHIADNVSWTLTGRDDPLGGNCTTKAEVAGKIFAPIYQKMDGALKAEIVPIENPTQEPPSLSADDAHDFQSREDGEDEMFQDLGECGFGVRDMWLGSAEL